MPYKPDTTCPTVSAELLAEWLGYAGAPNFQNASRKLIAEHGFPRKLPGLRLWSRAAVLQWIERCGGADPAISLAGAAAFDPVLDPGFDHIEAARQDLERLYAGDGFIFGQMSEAAE